MDGFLIGKKSLDRIGAVVKTVEGSPTKLYTWRRDRKGGGGRSEIWTLSHTINTSTGVCAITAGRWVRMGAAVITIAAASVTLTGTTEFVWVKHDRTAGAVVGHSSNYPTTTDSTNAYVVLVSFTKTGSSYDQGTIHHKGDIYFDLPLV